MTELKPIGELPEFTKRRRNLTPDTLPLSDSEALVLELVQMGIALRKAENLVARYPAEQIRRQLRWLPLRGAKRAASLLIAAIEQDYEAPIYGGHD